MSNILLLFVLIIFSFQNLSSSPFKVMSYNIRYAAPEDYNSSDGWNDRKERLVQFYKYHNPQIIGMQEVTWMQLEYIKNNMPEYESYGVGREDGKKGGEFVPVFYNSKRFELIDGGSFWLSETPEKPSIGWDAALKRIVTYVFLKDKITDNKFYFFNTHFDHKGESARLNSGKLLTEKINSIAGEYPVILTGDFNTVPDSAPYNAITEYLNDCYLISKTKPYGPVGTSSGFDVCC
jgi:endonuclease/exonuclease/phosphatase family metal-dependent hydrolase